MPTFNLILTQLFVLTAIVAQPAQNYFHETICRMQWLPLQSRQCLASELFTKESLGKGNNVLGIGGSEKRSSSFLGGILKSFSGSLAGGSSSATLKLERIGEAMLEKGGHWTMNDESQARRSQSDIGAFFHYRHWDDVTQNGGHTFITQFIYCHYILLKFYKVLRKMYNNWENYLKYYDRVKFTNIS